MPLNERRPHDGGRCNLCPRRFFEWLKKLRADEASRHSPDTSAERFFGTLKTPKRYDVPVRLAVGHQFHASDTMLRRHESADWQHVPVHLRLFAARFIEAMRRRDIPLYAHGAFRTAKEQQDMLARGVSNAQWPRAPHCQGKAVDIVHGRYHWELQPDEWQFLGKVGKEIAAKMGVPIVWGGDWDFYDPAHWELADWKDDVRRLQAGEPQRLTPRGILAKFGGRR